MSDSFNRFARIRSAGLQDFDLLLTFAMVCSGVMLDLAGCGSRSNAQLPPISPWPGVQGRRGIP